MNIFVLDESPIQSAIYQCDKHVVKMTLETAQLLSSAYPKNTAPYKTAYFNHPLSKWTRYSKENYLWLIKHGMALSKEYTHRYNKKHKSQLVIQWCYDNIDKVIFSSSGLSDFYLAMPDDCKCSDPVESYRNYYRKYKRLFAKWTNRPTPGWF